MGYMLRARMAPLSSFPRPGAGSLNFSQWELTLSPTDLSLSPYGNECWELSKIQSQLDSDKYEAKGHIVIKPFLTNGKYSHD